MLKKVGIKGNQAPEKIYATWNKVAKVLKEIGGYEGFDEREEDIPVRLVLMEDEDLYEVEVQTKYGNYDTCYFLPSGSPTNLRDWGSQRNCEGVAVPVEVAEYLEQED